MYLICNTQQISIHHHFIFTICCTGHKNPGTGKQLTRKEEVSASRERLIYKEEEDPGPNATNNRGEHWFSDTGPLEQGIKTS